MPCFHYYLLLFRTGSAVLASLLLLAVDVHSQPNRPGGSKAEAATKLAPTWLRNSKNGPVSVEKLVFSTDGKSLAVIDRLNSVWFWPDLSQDPIEIQKAVGSSLPGNEQYSISISPDGTLLAWSEQNGREGVYDLKAGKFNFHLKN